MGGVGGNLGKAFKPLPFSRAFFVTPSQMKEDISGVKEGLFGTAAAPAPAQTPPPVPTNREAAAKGDTLMVQWAKMFERGRAATNPTGGAGLLGGTGTVSRILLGR